MSERKPGSTKGSKAERPKRKAVVKSDTENNSALGTPHSALKENSVIDTPQSDLKETLTTDNSPLTTKMEVHHHPDVEKKGLKEYILEGLMIFLAVTMGFFAETIREHYTEHKNAEILAHSLLEDMKKDTASLHSLIAFGNKRMVAADSVLSIFHSPRSGWNSQSIYTNMVPLLTSLPFISTDGTYTQMKTSGTLRYFNQPLVNIINAYGVQLNKTVYRDDVTTKGMWIMADMIFDTMSAEALNDLRAKKPVTHEMYIRIENVKTNDKFINLIAVNKGFGFRSLQEYQQQLTIADKLIEALKKEYSLDNE